MAVIVRSLYSFELFPQTACQFIGSLAAQRQVRVQRPRPQTLTPSQDAAQVILAEHSIGLARGFVSPHHKQQAAPIA